MKKVILFLLAMTAAAAAQNIVLKDGKTVAAKSLRRIGDTIMATVELPVTEPGQPIKTGELGYPLAQIARLDFPEPRGLRTVPDLIVSGKAAEALLLVEPVVSYFERFRDAPGSWWVEALLLKCQSLDSLNRKEEAERILQQFTGAFSDPETARAVEVRLAFRFLRNGAYDQAWEVAERILKESKSARALAPASILRGECLLAKKSWDDAVLAFLRTPVCYPGEKVLLPQSMLGAGRAEYGMEDFKQAKATLEELIKTYDGTSQAVEARRELDKIARSERALAPPQ